MRCCQICASCCFALRTQHTRGNDRVCAELDRMRRSDYEVHFVSQARNNAKLAALVVTFLNALFDSGAVLRDAAVSDQMGKERPAAGHQRFQGSDGVGGPGTEIHRQSDPVACLNICYHKL